MDLNQICVDWGCINGFVGKKAEDFRKARIEHIRLCEDDHSKHELKVRHLNCFGTHDEYYCECGFRYNVDCS